MKMGKIHLLVGIKNELQEEINFIEDKNKDDNLILLGMTMGMKMSQRLLDKYHVGWPKKVENYDPEKGEVS